MKKWMRILSAMLCGALLVSLITACGAKEDDNEKGNDQTTTSASAGGSDVTTTTTDPKLQYDPDLTADDWKAADFTILYNGTEVEPNKDFDTSGLTGNVLNDAIYNRNIYIQEKYNLNIKIFAY